MESDGVALARAIALACRAHRGQRYPAPCAEPFILHPLRVMVAVDGALEQMTAVLHDVLEDTTMAATDLQAADLPDAVIEAVVVLTHEDGCTYEAYIGDVASNDLARVVKQADIADNLRNNRRLPQTPDVVARTGRYERALKRLSA
jgi:(p)ppGpp synthase/HD superfamily hydrolase